MWIFLLKKCHMELELNIWLHIYMNHSFFFHGVCPLFIWLHILKNTKTAPMPIFTQGFAISGFLTEMHQSEGNLGIYYSDYIRDVFTYSNKSKSRRCKFCICSLPGISYNLDMLFGSQSIRNRATQLWYIYTNI